MNAVEKKAEADAADKLEAWLQERGLTLEDVDGIPAEDNLYVWWLEFYPAQRELDPWSLPVVSADVPDFRNNHMYPMVKCVSLDGSTTNVNMRHIESVTSTKCWKEAN